MFAIMRVITCRVSNTAVDIADRLQPSSSIASSVSELCDSSMSACGEFGQ